MGRGRFRALNSSPGPSLDGIEIRQHHADLARSTGWDLAAASRSWGHVSKRTKTRINLESMRWLRGLRYFLA